MDAAIELSRETQRAVLAAVDSRKTAVPVRTLIELVVASDDRRFSADRVRGAINALLAREVLEMRGDRVRRARSEVALTYAP
jgi:hypothetical protein